MNIGNLKLTRGNYIGGVIATATVSLNVALRINESTHERSPKYDVLVLNPNRHWVNVGALFELASNGTGEAFLQGKLDDPSFTEPLNIAGFYQQDGSINIAWRRPEARSSLPKGSFASDDLPPLPGADDDVDAGAPPPPAQSRARGRRKPQGNADDGGLGATTANDAQGNGDADPAGRDVETAGANGEHQPAS
jgi:uncharacterized protein (DUF736 family)